MEGRFAPTGSGVLGLDVFPLHPTAGGLSWADKIKVMEARKSNMVKQGTPAYCPIYVVRSTESSASPKVRLE